MDLVDQQWDNNYRLISRHSKGPVRWWLFLHSTPYHPSQLTVAESSRSLSESTGRLCKWLGNSAEGSCPQLHMSVTQRRGGGCLYIGQSLCPGTRPNYLRHIGRAGSPMSPPANFPSDWVLDECRCRRVESLILLSNYKCRLLLQSWRWTCSVRRNLSTHYY